jgi:hypothetical protein
MIEEGFLEVFASLIYGSGWMDRTETTFRDCNWALVRLWLLLGTILRLIYFSVGRIQGNAHPKTTEPAVW